MKQSFQGRHRHSLSGVWRLLSAALLMLGLTMQPLLAGAQANEHAAPWQTVVNNNDLVPGSDRTFNSYNQPSVNSRGLVVFRARSTGQQQGPLSGIFTRDMSRRGQPIETIANRDTVVPQPNNTEYPNGSGNLATFNEFPAFPRIAIDGPVVATRGNSQPVWTYIPEGESEETRVGTSGVYVHTEGVLQTGASQLGAAPGFAYYQVPGAVPGTRFDQFPGAPSVNERGVAVFKGNYTEDGIGQTGVYFRDTLAGDISVQLVANSVTAIPGDTINFGSTAPPTAAYDRTVFVGVDNEEAPTTGGIYLAPLVDSPALALLVAIGDAVPGAAGEVFNRFGEGLAFDGRYVAFWGSWGDETRTLRLYCPEEGNKDRRDFCNKVGGNGDPNSTCDATGCYQDLAVPVNQGVFVHDTERGTTLPLAGAPGDYDDFLFWNYSGAPPSDDNADDRHPPRWRSSAFVAVSGRGASFGAAWKARSGEVVDRQYVDPLDGVYFRRLPGNSPTVIMVDTNTAGQRLDRAAPADSHVAEIGLERDGLRGNLLAISASMESEGEEEDGMAGIYMTRVR